MKWLAESLPFQLFTNPSMINRFTFGHGVVIYYLVHALSTAYVFTRFKNSKIIQK